MDGRYNSPVLDNMPRTRTHSDYSHHHEPPNPRNLSTVHSSGGYRRVSYTGRSSDQPAALSDFEHAIFRTPTDQSRVFQSNYSTPSEYSPHRPYSDNMASKPPPPTVPPPYATSQSIHNGAPSRGNYGMASSFDSYHPNMMHKHMQQWRQPPVPALSVTNPPLPPGVAGLSSPVENPYRAQKGFLHPPRYSGQTSSIGVASSPLIVRGAQFAPPSQQPVSPNSLRQVGDTQAVGKKAEADSASCLKGESLEDGESSSSPQPDVMKSKTKSDGDDSDPFFAFDET